MYELAIISGKGGTGKTSLTAAFAHLSGQAVLADCDVDAADLQLLLAPVERRRTPFKSGHLAVVNQQRCLGCGGCLTYCSFDAVRKSPGGAGEASFTIDPIACEGCGVCVEFCPMNAIDFPERECGDWFISDTACGPLVHAELAIAAENSGKLVTTVRQAAKRLAAETGRELILIDGPPGIGCPVIASITDTDQVLVITEPTVSGAHDLERVLKLAHHFNVPAVTCINKWDLNPEQTDLMTQLSLSHDAPVLGRIPFDPAVSRALRQGASVLTTNPTSPAAVAIRQLWEQLPTQ